MNEPSTLRQDFDDEPNSSCSPLPQGEPFQPSGLQLLIRPMTLDDLPQVVEIDRLSFSLPWPSNSYRFELTQNETSHCWVATLRPGKAEIPPDTEDEKRAAKFPFLSSQQTSQSPPGLVVAILVLWLIEDEAHIATVAVHPDFRGRGLGRRILLTALHDAVVHGATMSTLEVRESNQTAIQLYRQLGFELVGRRSRYYQDTYEDALIMTAEPISLPEIERLMDVYKEETP